MHGQQNIKKKKHSSYSNYYSPCCDKNWSPYLLSLSRASWLSKQRTFEAHALFPGHCVPNPSTAHSTQHPAGTRGSFHRVNDTEEWSWPHPSSCFVKKGQSCKPLPLSRKLTFCRAYVSKIQIFICFYFISNCLLLIRICNYDFAADFAFVSRS